MVFEYVVTHEPEEGPDVLIDSSKILADNENVARMKVVRGLDSIWDDKLDEVKIRVRPF